jgi:hypothetical protein
VTTPEPAVGPSGSRLWVPLAGGLVLVLLSTALAWHAVGGGGGDVDPEPRSRSAARAQRAEQALANLATAWGDRDRAAFFEAAGEAAGASAWAGRTYDALRLLDVSEVSLRFLAERAQRSEVSVPGAPQTFVADVEVGWVLDGYRTTTSTVGLLFGDSDEAASVLGLAGGSAVAPGGALPLWLAGQLVADRRGSRCLGVDTAPAAVHCDRLTRIAEGDLTAVLPASDRDTPWWVVVPSTSAQAAAMLASGPSGLDQVAAVTSTLDASGSPGAPGVVVLNPDVFGGLRPAAAQLVMSHEAVHAATAAASVQLPLWVAEGFADYVALRDGRVPVQQAASQLLATVRRAGPPRRLPADADFSASRHGPGQTYEAAWLVFRMLGERYGDDAVVAFYASVLGGTALGRALEATTGLTPAELTSAWRRYLVRLAD